MKKLLGIIVLGLLLSFNANADVKWPKFMTKEIPKELLNKINDSSNNESYTTNFSYDYTQDGYPRNIVATETDGGEQYTSTIILEYN